MKKVLLIGFVFITSFAFGQGTYSWIGGDGGDWGNAANWQLTSGSDDDGNGVPDGNDDVIIAGGESFAEVNSPQAAASLTITGGSRASRFLDIYSTLDVNGDITLNSYGSIFLWGGTIEIAGNVIDNGGSFNPNYDPAVNGVGTTIYNGSSGQLVYDATGNDNFGLYNDYGNLTISTAGSAYLTGNTVVDGVMNITSGSILDLNEFLLTLNGTITGTGQLDANNPSGTSASELTINGSGEFGNLYFSAGSSLDDFTFNRTSTRFTSGTATLVSDLTVNRFIQTAGDLNLTSGSTFIISTTYTRDSGSIIGNNGNVVFTSTLPTTVPLLGTFTEVTLNRANVTLNLTSSITVNNELNVVLGTFNKGSFDLDNDGNLTISSGATYHSSGGTTFLTGDLINNGSYTSSGGTIEFNGTSVISGSSSPQFNNVVITTSLTSGSEGFIVSGNFTNNGTFNANNASIEFNGSTTFSGSAITTFYDILANGTLNFTSTVELTHEMNFTSSANVDFDGSGSGNFVMLSFSETNTARLGNMNGATVSGDLTLERFIDKQVIELPAPPGDPDAEPTLTSEQYMYLTSPLQNVTVADWQEEIKIYGNFPETDCQGCSREAISLFYYDEKHTGNLSEGYEPFPTTSNTETFVRGRGYALWMFDEDFGLENTLSMRGSVVNSNQYNFNVTFTPNTEGIPSEENDGWNLVGNPFLSPIDWSSATGWDFNNVYETIYIKDNYGESALTPGDYIVYSRGSGIRTGNQEFDGVVAIGQGFWVKANGSNPHLYATQEVKTDVNPMHVYRTSNSEKISDKEEPKNVFRIYLNKGEYKDETVIHFNDNATEGMDLKYDAPKFYNSRLNIATLGGNNQDMVINSLPMDINSREVKISVHPQNPKGEYTLSFGGLNTFDYSGIEVWLYDSYENKEMKVTEGSSYSFSISDDPASAGSERFKVSFGNIILSSDEDKIQNADVRIYPNPASDQATVELINGNAKMELLSLEGKILFEETLSQGKNQINLSSLKSGIYIIKVSGESVYHTERIVKY